MDIEFVELEHRPSINTLMEACGLDLETAYNLFHRHNCDLQAAISDHFGLMSPVRIPPSPHEEMMGGSFDEDGDVDFHRYCRFMEDGPVFWKRYPVKNEAGQKVPQNGNRPSENHSFKKELESLLGNTVNLTIQSGKIEDGLRWSWKEKFPVAILIIDFEQGSAIKETLSDDSFLNDLRTYFKVYGFDPASSRLDPWLTKFINLPADINSLLIFRVNLVDQIETLAKIPLSTPPVEIRTRLQRVKSESIQRELDEAHIVKEHAIKRNGRLYHRPQPIRQKIKQREDARLRRRQDEEFMKACKPLNIESKRKDPLEPKISQEQLKAQREEKRRGLKEYASGLQLKLRMPSGRAYQLMVGENEMVQYLFDYVDSCTEDIGFEKDTHRLFDIVYGYSKNQSLRSKQQTPIGQVLQQCQLLIVKQLEE